MLAQQYTRGPLAHGFFVTVPPPQLCGAVANDGSATGIAAAELLLSSFHVLRTVPTIVPEMRQNSVSRANASQLTRSGK
jgi:hypothetical protein